MRERTGALTFEEKVAAAHAHFVHGVDQHVIAALLGVNQGRISEACTAVKLGLEVPYAARLDVVRNKNG